MNEAVQSEIIFYNTPEGSIKVELIYNEETFWLSQKRKHFQDLRAKRRFNYTENPDSSKRGNLPSFQGS